MTHIEVREIDVTSTEDPAVKKWADMLDFQSWGSRQNPYPKKAVEEIVHAKYAVGVFVDNELVSAACITDYNSSSDGQEREALYFALAVTDESHKRCGYWEILYGRRMEWLLQYGQGYQVLATTENLRHLYGLVKRGWELHRMGLNEANQPFVVAELIRQEG